MEASYYENRAKVQLIMGGLWMLLAGGMLTILLGMDMYLYPVTYFLIAGVFCLVMRLMVVSFIESHQAIHCLRIVTEKHAV